MKILPVNLDNLIQARTVESVRREFKKTWSDQTLEQVTRTVCAFANDFFNLNGGYIVIGVEEREGRPVLPPAGLENFNLDEIQQKIRGQCRRIDPEYQPVISPEIFQERQILVIWAPAGDSRPYQAPKSLNSGERAFYVRQASQTVEAKGEILTQLMQMTARVPFDDRRNASVSVDVISPALVRNYLADVKSDLLRAAPPLSETELYQKLRLTAPINEHDAPRNVALMLFTIDPTEYFPGARIEIAQFADDTGGDLIEEKIFKGPLHVQIRQVVDYLNSLSTTMIEKVPGKAEALRTVAFPYGAMEEAVVNAIYHRGYDNVYEPTKVYLYPDRMEITSYPGPMPGLELRHFQPNTTLPSVPNRNRRIGEFLHELDLAESKGTGIPKIHRKMKDNGSPPPVFDFDEARTYFRVILPAHPQYIMINTLRESGRLWALGDRKRAIAGLEEAIQKLPNSGVLIAQLLHYTLSQGKIAAANQLYNEAMKRPNVDNRHLIAAAMKAQPTRSQNSERLHFLQEAHDFYSTRFDLIKNNPKEVCEFARVKMKLSSALPAKELRTKRELTNEAMELFRRFIQLSDQDSQKAWAWFSIARALARLSSPQSEIQQAYLKAVELKPAEQKFTGWYNEWLKRSQRKQQ